MAVTKAVIPCAGRGTRFLPISRAFPKELMPVVDRPCLDFIIDEAAASGIRDVLIIISPEKEVIKNYFAGDPALMKSLYDAGKTELAKLCIKRKDINIHYAVQEKPLGTAYAVMLARDFVGEDDFALMWGDDLILGKPATAELIAVYEKYGKTVVGCQQIDCDIDKYAAMEIAKDLDGAYLISGLVEKPKGVPPSNLASLGRYIIKNEAFDYIEKLQVEEGKELLFPDALNLMAKDGKVVAACFSGERFDIGKKSGALEAAIRVGIDHPETRYSLCRYLRKLKF